MAYRDLLDHQNDTRLIFRERLAAGLDNAPFFEQLREQGSTAEAGPNFWDAAAEATNRAESGAASPTARTQDAQHEAPVEERSNTGSGGIGFLGFGLLMLGESLFATFIAAEPEPRPRGHRERDPFELAAEEASKRLQQERWDAEEEWRQREKVRVRD